MSKGLKVTFLVHAIISLVSGIGLFFIPSAFATMVSWEPLDPTITRFFGAALLALAVSSWLGYRATNWGEVRLVVAMEIAYTVLATLGNLYSLLTEGAPSFSWVNLAITAVFAILWIYFYARAPRKA